MKCPRCRCECKKILMWRYKTIRETAIETVIEIPYYYWYCPSCKYGWLEVVK